MRLAACAVVVLLAAPAVASAQVDRTVVSGPLTATVSADPWSVAFTDAAGKPVLSEAAGDGLGFQTALGWFRATKVLDEARDGAAYTATLATNDPAGATIARADRAGRRRRDRVERDGVRRAGVQQTGIGLRRAGGRALPRLRRALQRRSTSAAARSRTTSPTGPTSPRSGR